ncbi:MULTISPECIES: NUDIX domain-containing protein [unclassified Wenzhouxiangella]|uniref:NUDIX hydrolase n=1 Tax=unclassified Wenzhouxiangella TaxID=2613841 RepID=UPI000E32B287|nr:MULTISPECIES: NUDIX domain-containing protein [unclassified Wenzhouxiangella]RFF27445.1 NUDIX domain-containing protein [Wenzhouxiangella sp. 15181]RFP68873.1 NUDIX domain-containing protein [Wenzhouxiangella sp. 15190]
MEETLVGDRLIRTVAAVIADERGRVLLVRKCASAFFIQPGGKRESGEDSLTTLARELREEIGVNFDPARAVLLGEFEAQAVHEPGRRVRAEAFVVAIEGEPRAAAEIEELAWVDPDDPGNLNVAPLSRRHILPAFLGRRETDAV